MNKQKKPYNKPGIVFENFITGELTGTPEMIEKIKASRADNLEEAVCGGTKDVPSTRLLAKKRRVVAVSNENYVKNRI